MLLVYFTEHMATMSAAIYIKTLVKLHRAFSDKCHNIYADDIELLYDNAYPHVAAPVH